MIGQHLLADLRGIAPEKLRDKPLLERALLSAAKRAALTPVCAPLMHVFDGGGMTGVLLLSESHIALHSYPEFGYLALDIFSCGRGDPNAALAAFREALQPTLETASVHSRGQGVE